MDRRTSLKWMLSAASALPLMQLTGCSSEPPPPRLPSGVGYGTDPDLLKVYRPGSTLAADAGAKRSGASRPRCAT